MWRIIVLIVTYLAVAVGSKDTTFGWGGTTNKISAAEGRRRVCAHSRCDRQPCGRTGQVLAFGSRTKATLDRTAVGVRDVDVVAGEVKNVGESCSDNAAADPSMEPTMVKRVQNFFVDVGEGSKALWTNFQTCQDIRKRVKNGHEVTYAEYAHLERGALDRGKLLQIIVGYTIAPQFFPLIATYSRGLLPSTFVKQRGLHHNYKMSADSRVTATLRGIEQLESKLLATRFKLGNRRNKELELLEAQREGLSNILEVGSKREMFMGLHEHMVAPEPAENGKGSRRKKQPQPVPDCKIPNRVTSALGRGMGYAWFGYTPGFYLSYRINEHVKDLGRGDEVLRRASLGSLSESDLLEACNARAIDVDGGQGSPQALRKSLAEWLELTEAAPRDLEPGVVFLPDRARLLGLGLNFLDTAREGRRAELSRKAFAKTW